MRINNDNRNFEAIVIGGSAGSIPVVAQIIHALPLYFDLPVFICLHRMRNRSEGMLEIFSNQSLIRVIEPNDKEPIKAGTIYIAPSNYHMFITGNYQINLSTDFQENYSRPSIDITFESCARVYKNNLIGIILTGANKDGVHGMGEIHREGGLTIAQEPKECFAPYMPEAAIAEQFIDQKLSINQIINLLTDKSHFNIKFP